MTESTSRRWDHETMLVVWLAGAVALISFFSYLRYGDVLLYGDAVAHINIARRVFDSRTPGLLQLGTVWLPLPHLLMIPFLLSDGWWRSGIGGSIPSLLAFVLGAAAIFRLVRGALSSDSTPQGEPSPAVRVAAWMAAAIYVANPNLIYLQATAMTEALYLGLFLWAVVHFSEFVRALGGAPEQLAEANSSLVKCGLCLLGACLTRYDGWFLAVAHGGRGAVGRVEERAREGKGWAAVWRNLSCWRRRRRFSGLPITPSFIRIRWSLPTGRTRHARIELRTSPPGSAPHPGSRNLAEAATYFLKAAELNLASGNWGRAWVGVGVAGLILGAAGGGRSLWPLLMLGVPLPFYMLSIAYGGVPIFLPVWWPYSLYNARYGVQLLPAFAVAAAMAAYFAARLVSQHQGQSPGGGSPGDFCGRQLCLGLVAAAGEFSRSLEQFAHPASAREGTGERARRITSQRHLSHVPGRSCRRARDRGNPAAAGHLRRQSPDLEAAFRSPGLMGAGFGGPGALRGFCGGLGRRRRLDAGWNGRGSSHFS